MEILQSNRSSIGQFVMQIARVIGTVVSTQKHRTFEGAKLLLVQPISLDDTRAARRCSRSIRVGAGVHEKVLIVHGRARGGRSARPQGSAGRCRRHRHHRSGGHPRMTEQELRALVRRRSRASARAGTSTRAPCAPRAPRTSHLRTRRHGRLLRCRRRGCRRPVHHRTRRDVQSLRLLQVAGTLTNLPQDPPFFSPARFLRRFSPSSNPSARSTSSARTASTSCRTTSWSRASRGSRRSSA